MQDIIREYGPTLITVCAILALITVVTAIIGTDSNGIVGKAFSDLLKSFFDAAMPAVKG